MSKLYKLSSLLWCYICPCSDTSPSTSRPAGSSSAAGPSMDSRYKKAGHTNDFMNNVGTSTKFQLGWLFFSKKFSYLRNKVF